MVVTILAIVCIILLALVTAAGYRAVIKGSGPSSAVPESERCALCRNAFARTELVERQIGDYKLLYFCRPCIARLASDAGLRS